MSKIICITGPESSGKTTLSAQLARHFKAPLVPEYARQFLAVRDNKYTFRDLETIACRQEAAIARVARKNNALVIADTDVQVVYIWSSFRYQKVAPWIERCWRQKQETAYLLCTPDLPWVFDPMRESPSLAERKELFELYHKMLLKKGVDFSVISGDDKQRPASAIRFVDTIV